MSRLRKYELVSVKGNEFVGVLHCYEERVEDDTEIRVEAAAAERKRVCAEIRAAIESEPELPGEMPNEMWQEIRGDKNATAEAMRIVVRETKKNLLAKLNQLEGE